MSTSSRPTRLQWGLLALIVALAALVRFIHLGSTEAHFDELWHLELSTGRGSIHTNLRQDQLIPHAESPTSLQDAPPWHRIWTCIDSVTHPPLFPLLLRAWRSVFGESVPIARALPAVFSILCVPLLFEAVRRQFGAGAGLWAALILALSSAQVDHAQEVRNYPLATAMCLGAGCALVKVDSSGASLNRLISLALLTLAALLSHYFVAPVILAFFLYTGLRLRGDTRARALMAIGAGCFLFVILWGPLLIRQLPTFMYAASDPGGLLDDAPGAPARTFARLSAVPVRQLFEPRQRMQLIGAAGIVAFALPWMLLRRSPALLLWAMWLTLVAAFALMIDLTKSTRHLEQLRHTILAGPALCAILACALSGMRPLLSNGFPAVVALACAIALPMTYTRQNPRYSVIGRALSDPATKSEPVVFYSDRQLSFWADLMYLGGAHYSGTFPRPAAMIHAPTNARLLDDLRHSQHIWLVWGGTHLDSDDIIPGTREVFRTGDPHLGFVARLEWVDRIPSPP